MSARSRTRGGYRQRLGLPTHGKARAASRPPVVDRSPGQQWATHIATKFLTNKSSAREAQEDAHLSGAAGASGVGCIAKVGNHGKAPQNCARDIKRLVARGAPAPEPYMVTIPVTDPKTNKVVEVEHPVLLPHEMMAYIISTGVASVVDLADVAHRTDQTLDNHKKKFCAAHGLPEGTCIPIGFHGDGVPFQKSTHKNSSTEVYSWNFLCDRDGKRYLFANIHKDFLCKCGCSGRCTMEPLFAVFVWSMQILFGGLHPRERHDGAPLDPARAKLAGRSLGFHALLMQARGDWQWYNQVFQFPSWAAGQVCWRCKASQEGRLAYWHCGPTAAWRRARYARGEFVCKLAWARPPAQPTIFLPRFHR